jgi:hypothetical protein
MQKEAADGGPHSPNPFLQQPPSAPGTPVPVEAIEAMSVGLAQMQVGEVGEG